jgi:hypothetical protein
MYIPAPTAGLAMRGRRAAVKPLTIAWGGLRTRIVTRRAR